MNITYIAVVKKAELHKNLQSSFNFIITFPDFPTCITAGNDLIEAKLMAEEALQFHVVGILEDEEELPAPTNIIEIWEIYRDSEVFLSIEVKI